MNQKKQRGQNIGWNTRQKKRRRELVQGMRDLADKIEQTTKEGKMKRSILNIIWQDFAEAKDNTDTYLDD